MSLVPVIKRKPTVLRHWLLSAHKAQIIIVVVLALLSLVIAPLLDVLLSKIFAPVTTTMLFGIIHTTQVNPDLETAQRIVHGLVWLSALLLALTLYLRYLPVAVDTARHIAREKERLADQLVVTNPAQSILLYNAARDWSCDEDTEAAISAKLRALHARVPPGKGNRTTRTSAQAVEGTLIQSAEELQREPRHAIIADRYQIKRQLGSGAMGIVYLAEDQKLNREIALKQLAPALATDAALLARFRQEALALARLSHPHIVQVYDFLEWQDLSLIVMEFVAGEELETWLRHRGQLAIPDVITLVVQMADALAYAHERGVVHRDFKPANVLIRLDGNIKVTDFGIAKLATSSVHTQLHTIMGSPAYMSPEQANGDPTDHRTDIYALGIVLFELLIGKRPFEGDMAAVLAQHVTKMPPSLRTLRDAIPPSLEDIVQTMLAKRPGDRFASMTDVITQLNRV